MADIPSNRQSILAVEEASSPVLGSGEGWQVEAEGPAAREWVPQTQVSNKLEATSLLTPERAIQLPLGCVKNFRLCNCYRDYIAVDESAYGCPYVSARGIKNLLSKFGIGLWLVDMKNRLHQRED